jgi:hypothetical protein
MKKFKLTKKRMKVLKMLEWFTPEKSSYEVVMRRGTFRLSKAKQKKSGIEPLEAFFLKSERGIDVESCTNIVELERLLRAQRYMAMMVKMWNEGVRDGNIGPIDFDDEPDYIKEFFVEKSFKPNKLGWLERRLKFCRTFSKNRIKSVIDSKK